MAIHSRICEEGSVFDNEIIGEDKILDMPFEDLPSIVQKEIVDSFLKDVDWDHAKEDYENSWRVRDTLEEITLKPVSQWNA